MRTLRLILYFVLGLSLGGLVTLAHAETIAATTNAWETSPADWGDGSYGAPFYSTPEAYCQAYTAGDTTTRMSAYSAVCYRSGGSFDANVTKACARGYSATLTGSPNADGSCYKAGTSYSCPSNWILSGSTCTRPDTCVPADLGEGWYARGKDETGLTNNDYCESGCVVQLALVIGSSSDYYYNSTTRWDKYSKSRTSTTCTGSTPTPTGSTSPPKDPEKKPPCAQGEGVITTSSGQVLCVPAATSPDQPKVNTSTKKTDYPDGSSTTTNVTQTCTGEGACSTTTTTTTTGAGGGGTAGQAGTPGTTKTTDDKQKSDTSDFCAKNPTLQACKGGISEEGTQKQVLAEVKKLSSVDSSTDKSAITNTKSYTSTEGYEAAKAKDDELLNFANGTTKNASVEASKTTIEQALSSGFWTDIPTASCTTPTYVIAGHAIEWSRWCEIVGNIQEIGAYGMWIMLAISVFVMLTGGRQS